MPQQKQNEEEKESELARLDEWLLSSTERLGVGLMAGFLGSAVVRRRWPILLGLGMATGQCVGEYRAEVSDAGKQTKGNDGAKGKADEEKKKSPPS